MEEIKRLQQLAGIITEIKVNNPVDLEAIFQECWQEAEQEIGEWFEDEDGEDELDNESEVSEYAREIFQQRTGQNYDDLNEIKIQKPGIQGLHDRIVINYPPIQNTHFETTLRTLKTKQEIIDYLWKISGNKADGEDKSWAEHVVEVSK